MFQNIIMKSKEFAEACILLEQGHLDEAEVLLRKLRISHATSAEPLIGLGKCLLLQRRFEQFYLSWRSFNEFRTEEAMKAFEEGLSIKTSAAALHGIGLTLLQKVLFQSVALVLFLYLVRVSATLLSFSSGRR